MLNYLDMYAKFKYTYLTTNDNNAVVLYKNYFQSAGTMVNFWYNDQSYILTQTYQESSKIIGNSATSDTSWYYVWAVMNKDRANTYSYDIQFYFDTNSASTTSISTSTTNDTDQANPDGMSTIVIVLIAIGSVVFVTVIVIVAVCCYKKNRAKVQ